MPPPSRQSPPPPPVAQPAGVAPALTCKKVRSLLAHVQPKAATPAGLTAALHSLGLGDAALTCHEFPPGIR